MGTQKERSNLASLREWYTTWSFVARGWQGNRTPEFMWKIKISAQISDFPTENSPARDCPSKSRVPHSVNPARYHGMVRFRGGKRRWCGNACSTDIDFSCVEFSRTVATVWRVPLSRAIVYTILHSDRRSASVSQDGRAILTSDRWAMRIGSLLVETNAVQKSARIFRDRKRDEKINSAFFFSKENVREFVENGTSPFSSER